MKMIFTIFVLFSLIGLSNYVDSQTLSVSVQPISTMPIVGINPTVSYKTINNKIYLFGLAIPPYMTQFIPATASNQIRTYDLVSNTWAVLPFNLPYGIFDYGTASYFNNHFYFGPGWATGDVNGWGSHKKMIDVNLSNSSSQETDDQFSSDNIWLISSIEFNGRIYFFGGWNGSAVNTIFEFNPTANTFQQVASMINGKAGIAPILGNDSWIYIISASATIERFNPTTYQVQTMNASLPANDNTLNFWHISADNSIYFFDNWVINPTIFKYDYSTDILSNTGVTITGTFENRSIMDSNDPYSIYGFKDNPNNTTSLQLVKITLHSSTNCSYMPIVSISGLNSSYTINDAAVTMTGTPSGGTFYGMGVVGNTFNPSIAGSGTHTIVYVYDDGICNKAICESVDVTPNDVSEIQGQTTKLSIIPNPSNGIFNISFTVKNSENIIIQVFDVLGKQVYSETKTKYQGNYNNTIDLSNLSNGIYTISVKGGEKASGKIVIAK